MNGRIFTAYHFVPDRYRADDLYSPVVMGLEIGDRPGLLSDLHGDSPYYAPLGKGFDEICVKWYVWKNLLMKYDWVGFQQYRRLLNFGERTNDEIRALVEQYDIITCGPDETTNENPNLRESWRRYFHFPAWDVFEKLMGPDWNFTMPLNRPHNTWIMRSDEFDRYMTLWSSILFELARIVPFNVERPRIYGHLTERFSTLYLDRLSRERPETRVLVLPIDRRSRYFRDRKYVSKPQTHAEGRIEDNRR